MRNKYLEDVEKLIEDMVSNECHWSTQQKPPRAARINEVNDTTALAVEVKVLKRRFD